MDQYFLCVFVNDHTTDYSYYCHLFVNFSVSNVTGNGLHTTNYCPLTTSNQKQKNVYIYTNTE